MERSTALFRIITEPRLTEVCSQALRLGYALDDEEAEIDVGCIGVLLYDGTGNVAAGLSVSAPIERRRQAWVADVMATGREISAQLGFAGEVGVSG